MKKKPQTKKRYARMRYTVLVTIEGLAHPHHDEDSWVRVVSRALEVGLPLLNTHCGQRVITGWAATYTDYSGPVIRLHRGLVAHR